MSDAQLGAMARPGTMADSPSWMVTTIRSQRLAGARRRMARRELLVMARRIGAVLTLVVSLIAAVQLARADTVVLAQTGLVIGTQTTDTSVLAPGPGTLTVTLSDLTWPYSLQNLTFSATTASSVLKTLAGVGQTSFDVAGSGTFYAHVMGEAQGLLDIGLYSLKITFQPAAVVPLPSSGWLLLGALAGAGSLWKSRVAART
jgi:hypothetical protein